MLEVEVKVLDKRYLEEWGLPEYSTSGSAGLDIRAAIYDNLIICPNESLLIPSGLKIWLNNPDYVLLLLPRSGLGSKGLVLGNLVGVIDSDYQGEIMISVWNRSNNPIKIDPGMKIAQLVLVKIDKLSLKLVEEFSNTSHRGENGFGSSRT